VNPREFHLEADRCVKCGLCLPHCPTYLKLSDEADSPRGRIALIQALTNRQLPLTDKLQLHLDRCLGCRACEQICPSGVHYGKLIDAARTWIRNETDKSAPGLNPWLMAIYSDRERLRKLTRLLPPLRRSGLLRLVQKLAPNRYRPLLDVATLLPGKSASPGLHPARHSPRGEILEIFIGCVSSTADQPAIEAAIAALTRLGYAVHVSAKQTCCGALYRHNGYPDAAERMCQHNRKQTERSQAQALITLATACQLELSEQRASHLPVVDVVDFLVDHLKPSLLETNFSTTAKRVAVHTPCSARNDQTAKLLGLLPGLGVMTLPDNHICCGAAGSYFLTQPELSRRFGRDKLKHLKATRPDILVTSNTGCALQFRLLIDQEKLGIEVLHPIELINRQLRSSA